MHAFHSLPCGILMGLAVALHGGHIHTQQTQDLPEAATILDRHVEATGGKQAHLALKTRKTTGKLEVDMAGHQFEARVEKHAQAPGKTHVVIDGSFFFQVNVCDGDDAWEWRPSNLHAEDDGSGDEGQTTLKTGADRAKLIAESHFHGAVKWRERFAEVKTVGVAQVGERPAYEVSVTTKAGARYSQFYDQESGRLVKEDRPGQRNQMGVFDMQSFIGDYREVDGVWLPMSVKNVLTSEALGKGTQKWTYAKVEHGVKIAKALFELPEELQVQRLEERKKRAAHKKGPEKGHGH